MLNIPRRIKYLIVVFFMIGMLVGLYAFPCFTSHDYYNEYPEAWEVISTGHYTDEITDCYQVALSGDFLGTGEIVTVACYHHGHIGVFVNYREGNSWSRYPIHSRFDPANLEGWPTKGIVSADFDSDGFPEIITDMDSVFYPPNHINTTQKAFPGIVYIDPNEPNFEPQPLVWGAWGEKIASTSISNCVPKPAPPEFRSPTNNKMDILVPTMTKVENGNGARLFLLEQPDSGFDSINYTYETETIVGASPYENDPFYVKRFYVRNGSNIEELIWKPDDIPQATGVYAAGVVPIYLDSDENMDMIVSGGYTDGETFICGRITLYRRVTNASLTNFLFEEIQTYIIDDAQVGDGQSANLDGNLINGKESAVFGYSSNNTEYPYSGIITVLREGDNFRLVGLSNPSGIIYPYIRTYSRLVVMDCNEDGYDDAIIYCKEVASWEISYGDLVVFLNTKRGLSASDVFGLDEGEFRILFDNQAISWGLYAQQLDDDDDWEITVCNGVLIPHWCPLTPGVKYAYGLDVIDFLKLKAL